MRGVRELLVRCRSKTLRYHVLESLSGVSRFTFSRWGQRSPSLEQLRAVVETMGGRVLIELPEKPTRICRHCQERTQTLYRGGREFCGGCGVPRD